MTTADDETEGGKLIELRPDKAAYKSDVSFEVALDEEPEPGPPVPVDGPSAAVAIPESRPPVIPRHLRSPAGIVAAVKPHAGLLAYRAATHGVRSPRYLAEALFWSVFGLFRLVGKHFAWWWHAEMDSMRSEMAVKGDQAAYLRVHDTLSRIRKVRAGVIGAEVLAAVIGISVLVHLRLWWAWVILAAVAVPFLARLGRPADRRIIRPLAVTPRFRVLNGDVVLRAYYAAGLGHPAKPDMQVTFGSPMSRDGEGSRVVVDLPHGLGLKHAVDARDKIASGLDVTESQVFISRDPTSYRRHTLWVADRDPLAVPVGRTPLLACKPTDIWKDAPIGLDERGQLVRVPLMWNSVLVGAVPRAGKALALDTRVPTPSGWTTMGELEVGDQVFAENGVPCTVTDAWPVRHDRPCYEVEFSDGSLLVADADHQWLVDTRASRHSASRQHNYRHDHPALSQQHKREMPRVLTTADMIPHVSVGSDRRFNYSVRVPAPLQAPEQAMLVGPYTLGAWLGDGTGIFGIVHSQDPEVIAEIEAEGESTRVLPSTLASGRCPAYRVLGLQAKLKLIGVLGAKHIPVSYLRASESQRRALLAGLLDTDGYCDTRGRVEFVNKNERLAREVLHLVTTLGCKATLRSKTARLYGKDCGTVWTVFFVPPDKVFRLPRKACRQRVTVKSSSAHRYITAIRPVPSVPVRCITVDSPNRLYLVGDTCIPTHNTFSARLMALYAALDPHVMIDVFDGKGSPDWRKFALVADSFAFGLTPTREGLPPEILLATLERVKSDVQDRYHRLSELPTSVCPEGKLTREIARDPRFGMPVRVLVLEEFQEYYDLGDISTDIGTLIRFLVKVAPGAGVIVIGSTQRPSGVGSSQKLATLFVGARDNFQIRFGLRTSSWKMSDLVLGDGSYSEGLDTSVLLPQYKGVGILKGASDRNPTVRTYYADGKDAERILTAARAMRERAGTLSGMAAGEEVGQPPRDVLGDVLSAFAGEPGLHWPVVGDRLARKYPDRWADVTAEAISAQCRDLGVPSVNVNIGGQVLKGCRREHLEIVVKGGRP